MCVCVADEGALREGPGGSGQGDASVHGEHGAGVRAVAAVRGQEAALLQGAAARRQAAPRPLHQSQVSTSPLSCLRPQGGCCWFVVICIDERCYCSETSMQSPAMSRPHTNR